ncbi:MAG TPA: substrate-binding domain-containing protein, partial [Candidatus Bipolaricaulota bacterium]
MKTNSLFLWSALSLLLAFSLIGVSQSGQSAPQILELATTTSTVDSGLLNALHPPFELQFNAQVKVIALGTGAALRAGENGDVDVVLV